MASTAREITRETARINGVAERVLVHGRCRHLPAGLELLVCDIEGAEGDLLHAEALSSAMIMVETHDHAVPGITDVLISRLAHTHEVDVLGSIEADDTALLAWLSQKDQEIALDEMRAGAEQRWLVMRPRLQRDGQRVA